MIQKMILIGKAQKFFKILIRRINWWKLHAAALHRLAKPRDLELCMDALAVQEPCEYPPLSFSLIAGQC